MDDINSGVNEQEFAAPADIEDTYSENEADGFEEEAEPQTETAEPSEEQPEPEPQQQTAEDNSRYAAARRQAEAQLQRERAEKMQMQQELSELDKIARKRGFGSYRELMEAARKEDADREAAEYKDKYGVDPNAIKPLIDEAVNNNPVVLAAKQIQQQAAINEQMRAFDTGLEAIRKLDPSIQSKLDLPKMQNYDEFVQRVKSGMDMADAYKLVNFDTLQQRRSAAGKQSVLNSVNGRSHLNASGTGGNPSAVVVPTDVLEMYREFNPEATLDEIRKHYAKSRK